MTTTRERLQVLLDALSDDQVETVLRFAEALSKGRVVVSACEVPEPGAPFSRPLPPREDRHD